MPLSLTWPAFPDEGATNYNSSARASILALLSNGDVLESAVDVLNANYGGLVAGSGVLVSSDDTTIGFLDGKLLAGTEIDLTVGGPAGDETLTISHETGDGHLHVPANSTTNNGKVLTAGAVAGTYTWETPTTVDDVIALTIALGG